MPNVKIPVASRFVNAKHDDWGNRKGPALAFVCHMAEGNNVWRYLSTGNVARDVSVHFTVEADGEIVQMMNLNRISGSINPRTIRVTDDPNGNYGASDAKYVMKSWWKNPNNACITVEVAGRQKDGPNAKQVASLKRLFDYLRTVFPDINPLGHRDFQSVKPCPGQKFYKAVYPVLGGHGKDYKKPADTASGGDTPSKYTEDSMIYISEGARTQSDTLVFIPKGVGAFNSPTDKNPSIRTTIDSNREFYGQGRHSNSDWIAVKLYTGQSFSDKKPRYVIAWIKDDPAYVRTKVPFEDADVAQLRTAIKDIAAKTAALDKAVDTAAAL